MTNIQAIKLLNGLEQGLDDYCELNDEGKTAFRMAITALEVFDISEQLPSAQPERPSEIQDILDYLDTVLHPIISPEHWNVYSELHDMISTLSSAQLEQRWIPCSERLPEVSGGYLVSEHSPLGEFTCTRYWNQGDRRGYWSGDGYSTVIAWMPLPEPYREDGEADG